MQKSRNKKNQTNKQTEPKKWTPKNENIRRSSFEDPAENTYWAI